MINVSCIVPIYNLGKKVEKCINSIINQTLSDIEIILVNDCSTDNTLEILQKYESLHSNIVLIDLKENLRQGGARNEGIKRANGEFLIFIDGDDWIERDMLETLYTYAIDQKLEIVDSDYYQEDKIGNEHYKVSITEENLSNKKQLIMNAGRIVTKLFRKDLIIKHELYFLEHKKFEDNPFLPILFAYTDKIGKVNKAFYHYIYNSKSSSRKRNDYSVFDRLDTSIYLLKEVRRRNLYNQFKAEYDFIFINIFYVITIIMCITKFNIIPYNYIKKVFDEVQIYVPDYKENPYLKNSPRYMKIFVKSNLIELYCLITCLSIFQKIGLGNFMIRKAKRS